MSNSDRQVPASDVHEYGLSQLMAGLLIGGSIVALATALLILAGEIEAHVVPAFGVLSISEQLAAAGIVGLGMGLGLFWSNLRWSPA